ncbi:MAG TPA: hypothetical protein PLQ76_00930 [bacterium]|nr:hypothetical protein [bacterium]
MTERWIEIPAAYHVHTNASGGRYTLEEISSLAHDAGLRAVIVTDKADTRWTYGIAPFRGLARVTVERKSIKLTEYAEYRARFEKVGRERPDVLLIPGAEVSPFYRWEGRLADGKLRMLEWDRDMLVVGLKKDSDWKHLPIIGNEGAGKFGFSGSFHLFICAALCAGAFVVFAKKRKKSFKVGLWRKQKFSYDVHPYRPLSVVLFLLAVTLASLWYPFKRFPFDPYGHKYGLAPYQRMIDYVNDRGGISAWGHPHADMNRKFEGRNFLPGPLAGIPGLPSHLEIFADGAPYFDAVEGTEGFTAAPCPTESCSGEGCPCREWDGMLSEFTAGKRKSPPWNVGEIDFYGILPGKIDDFITVFFAKSNTEDAILDSFKHGRMYSVRNDRGYTLRLKEFNVRSGDGIAESGETIKTSSGGTTVRAVVGSIPEGMRVKAVLYRNGEIVGRYAGRSPLSIRYEDANPKKAGMSYYRLEARAAWRVLLISNPIFVIK